MTDGVCSLSLRHTVRMSLRGAQRRSNLNRSDEECQRALRHHSAWHRMPRASGKYEPNRNLSRTQNFFARGALTILALISGSRGCPGTGEKRRTEKRLSAALISGLPRIRAWRPGPPGGGNALTKRRRTRRYGKCTLGSCIMETRKFIVEVLWVFLGMGVSPIDLVLDPQSGDRNTAQSQPFHSHIQTTNSFSTNRWYCPSYVRPPPLDP
jgi:hypothetical protein